MPKFNVSIPFAGKLDFEIEAENEEDAIQEAINVDWRADFKSDDPRFIDVVEIETALEFVRGNVCYLPLRKACADQIDE